MKIEPTRIVTFTESALTWRKRVRAKKRAKQQAKHPVVDWIEAFIWAAFVVLLINQYLLQAYKIPSGSMIETLLLEDRIFVNKLVFGPELLPGVGKVRGFDRPDRGEVIIFENPSYISRGTAFTVVQRVIYMMTLSLVDIDRDENGQPRAYLLIKRAVAMAGDRLRVRDGELYLKPSGTERWIDEATYQAQAGIEYGVRRLVPEETRAKYPAAGRAEAAIDLNLTPTTEDAAALSAVQRASIDRVGLDVERTAGLQELVPHDRRTQRVTNVFRNGWYVPEGRVFPMGDNRDYSRDGRYFGAVTEQKVLGRAMFIYWPISRIGAVR